MNSAYHTIIIPSRPQPDTIISIFLLKKFGKEKYPGIESSSVQVLNSLPEKENSKTMSAKGYFLIDIGEGKFDHHSKKGSTASKLIAEDLGVAENKALAKLLSYAERDDKYGLGTISSDPIDKAFGLSALITDLNKILSQNPQKVIDLIIPVIHAHYQEEKRRFEDLPKEFEEKIQTKEVDIFEVRQNKKKLKVVVLESSNPSISGWLKSSMGLKADVVIQRMESGYTNILTRPLKRIDLRWSAAYLRTEEAKLSNRKLKLYMADLMRPGSISEVPEWYYDRATNSILNGGLNPQGINATKIPLEVIKDLLKQGLSETPIQAQGEKPFNRIEATPVFFEIKIPADKAKEIKDKIGLSSQGIKLHLPENYHITLGYIENCRTEEIPDLIGQATAILRPVQPFSIIIDPQNFKSGQAPGYPSKAFYFEISENRGGNILKQINLSLKDLDPAPIEQTFIPHLMIANALPGINEKFVEDTNIELNSNGKVEIPINKIRLTQVIKQPNGQTTYKAKHDFILAA